LARQSWVLMWSWGWWQNSQKGNLTS
jgi:hypothetical protein